MGFLDQVFYGNSLKAWMWAGIVALSLITILRVGRDVVASRLLKMAARTGTTVDDHLAAMLKRTRLFFILVISVYAGSLLLDLPRRPTGLIKAVTVLAVGVQVGLWLSSLIGVVVARYVGREIGQGSDAVAASTALNFVGRLLLWAGVLLWSLDNLGLKVGPLIAGLGVGGIAVALAAQNLLGDLFASFSILFDKPFVIGDFISVGDDRGTVERIGLKTTRLKSLSGEQLVISNADLLNSRIRNFKLLEERRVVFTIGVVYQTPYHKVVAIPGMIKEIIDTQPQVRFERAHFSQLADSSLNFEAVYWVKDPDYGRYMDINQAINLAIFKTFEEEGIEFAYPTRTLYVNSRNQTAGTRTPSHRPSNL
ncbi:MAG: mechanosensitive ion channel family protein [Acidobacteria bacterium]|nr:MAG: mechanosensitive ion channel family protein [Acidobacteriota bacterium]